MGKYEYKSETIPRMGDKMVDALNELGEDGWELAYVRYVYINSLEVILKRVKV